MKTLNYLNLAPLLISLVVANQAHAADGPGSDGGGNAVCNSVTKECKMVEQLQKHSLTEVKGYSIFKEKLEALRAVFPELAEGIEESSKKKTWTFVPREFDMLSLKQTGDLRFSSTQAAYQNDREIFVSQNALDQMDDEGAAFKLMHESVMAMQAERDASKVRVLTGKIFSTGPKDIQEAAAVNGFGIYFTQDQLKEQKQVVRLDYLAALDHALDFQAGQCRIDPDEWKKMVKSEKGTPAEQEAKQYAYSLDGMRRFEQMSTVENKGWLIPWSSPMHPMNGMVKGYHIGIYMPDILKRADFMATIENPRSYNKEFANAAHNLRENVSARTTWTTDSIQRNFSYILDHAQEDTSVIREHLAKNESFTDLLAMVYVLSKEDRNWKKDVAVPEYDRVRPILDKAFNKFGTVKPNQPKAMHIRMCADIASVRADIAKLKVKIGKKKAPIEPVVHSDLDLSDDSKPDSQAPAQ